MNHCEIFERSREERVKKMLAARLGLRDYVLENARQGDIQNIIDTIDQFGWTQQWLMNIGDRKGQILDQAIRTRQPKTVLELGKNSSVDVSIIYISFLALGTFLGYSSLRMIDQLPKDALLITIESDCQSAEIARAIHQYAGVSDRIDIVNDSTENVIPHLSETFNIDSFDLIFIDHGKDFYLRDFKLLENAGLIRSGTTIVADNVIIPGAPEYIEYVRNNPNYITRCYEEYFEYDNELVDGIEVSIRI